MTFELPDLPYDRSGLEPHISKETLDYAKQNKKPI